MRITALLTLALLACNSPGPDDTDDSGGGGDADTDADTDTDTGEGDPDRDDDGLTNDEEAALGTDPDNPDSDFEGLSDGDEVNTHGTDPLDADSDDDGLDDAVEIGMGTDPNDADSDDDGLSDGDEVAANTDPNDPDSDDGGMNDGDEVSNGRDPNDASDDDLPPTITITGSTQVGTSDDFTLEIAVDEPEGASYTVEWTQVGGTPVTFDTDAESQTVTAPAGAGGGNLVFEVTVSDGVHTTTQTVTVRLLLQEDRYVVLFDSPLYGLDDTYFNADIHDDVALVFSGSTYGFFDLSNPELPQTLTRTAGGGSNGVMVGEDALVLTGFLFPTDIQQVDASDPESPVPTGPALSSPLGGTLGVITNDGFRALAASQSNFGVIEPSLGGAGVTGTLPLSGTPPTSISGADADVAAMALPQGGTSILHLIDLSDPSNPAWGANFDLLTTEAAVVEMWEGSNGNLYVAACAGADRGYIFDVVDADTLANRRDLSWGCHSAVYGDDVLFMLDRNWGVRTYDVSDLSVALPEPGLLMVEGNKLVGVKGGVLWSVDDRLTGVQVVSNPADHIGPISEMPAFGEPAVAVGDRLFLNDIDNDAVFVVDTTDPYAISPVGTLNDGEAIVTMASHGDRLAVAYADRVEIRDGTQDSAPLIDTWATGSVFPDFVRFTSDDRLLVGDLATNEVALVQVGTATPLATVATGGIVGLTGTDDLLWVAINDSTVGTWDTSDPSSVVPHNASISFGGGGVSFPFLSGGRLYMGAHGVQPIDFSDPATPVQGIGFPLGGDTSAIAADIDEAWGADVRRTVRSGRFPTAQSGKLQSIWASRGRIDTLALTGSAAWGVNTAGYLSGFPRMDEPTVTQTNAATPIAGSLLEYDVVFAGPGPTGLRATCVTESGSCFVFVAGNGLYQVGWTLGNHVGQAEIAVVVGEGDYSLVAWHTVDVVAE